MRPIKRPQTALGLWAGWLPAGPRRLVDEACTARRGVADLPLNWLGPRTPVTCPDCGGTLLIAEGEEGGGPDCYRCHTGHADAEQTLTQPR